MSLALRNADRGRAGHGAARAGAFVLTAGFHVAVFGLALYGWQHAGTSAPRNTATLTVLPPRRDAEVRRPVAGDIAPRVAPEPAVVVVPPPPIVVASPMAQVLAEPLPVAAAPQGGREDELAQTTQAYCEAILARLERERAYPDALLRAGRHGAGTIAFRIDRGGRLIAAAVEETTGNKALDRAAVAIVRRAAPFPAIPPLLPDELAITLPVEFLIVRAGDQAAAR